MTDTDTLREALESIKANCFRSDLSDHTALVGIALIAKEALATLPKPEPAAVGDQVNAIINRNAEYMNGLDRGQQFFRTEAVIRMVTEALYASPVPSGGADERKQIVAWLRSEVAKDTGREEHILAWAANAVERGEHIETEPGYHRRAPSPSSEAISPPDARAVVGEE